MTRVVFGHGSKDLSITFLFFTRSANEAFPQDLKKGCRRIIRNTAQFTRSGDDTVILCAAKALNQVKIIFCRAQCFLDTDAFRRTGQAHPAITSAQAQQNLCRLYVFLSACVLFDG